LVLFIFNI